MNTTAAVFFLILGQADGYAGTGASSVGGLVVIPAHYESAVECEAAGEDARANNMGLSFLSYTCVQAQINTAGDVCEAPLRHSPRANWLQPHSASLANANWQKPERAGGVK